MLSILRMINPSCGTLSIMNGTSVLRCCNVRGKTKLIQTMENNGKRLCYNLIVELLSLLSNLRPCYITLRKIYLRRDHERGEERFHLGQYSMAKRDGVFT